MTDLVPSEPRIDRPALERIIQRAAELQAGEREIGDGLTEAELLNLGEDVGILPQHLRQALAEERTRAIIASERGLLARLAGPTRVAAQRIVSGTADEIGVALLQWMSEGELLQVKRRYPDRTSWERKEGAFASLKRSLGVGGRKYVLAGAAEVSSRITTVGDQQCSVQLVADLSNTVSGYVVGSAVVFGGGAAATGVALVLGVMTPFAVVPAILAAPLAVSILRSRRKDVEKFLVALEQVLDRLEHGETEARRGLLGPHSDTVGRLAKEIRKNLGI